jgi:hypothetical protein
MVTHIRSAVTIVSTGAAVAVTANTILSNTVGSSHAVQECKSVAPEYFDTASTRRARYGRRPVTGRGKAGSGGMG